MGFSESISYVRKTWKAFIAVPVVIASLLASSIPAVADYQAISVVGNPLTAGTAPYLNLSGLTGQSACTISVLAPFSGTISVEGLYSNTTNAQWTGPLTVYTPDGTTTTGTTISAAGSYIFNCGNMAAIRADGTSAAGTPTVTLNASGGVNVIAHIPGGGGGSGISSVSGTAPITVSTTAGAATVACPTCATGTPLPISVQAGSNVVVATPSPGVFVVSAITPSPAPAASPVSVQAGTGIAVATPSPGVFVISSTVSGTVTAVTGTGNISSSGGTTPNVTITNAPTFTGAVVGGGFTDTGLAINSCVGTNSVKTLNSINCVTSVSGTGNIASTGGTTPVVSVTNAPTFTGQVAAASYKASNLTSGDCLESLSGVVTSTSTSCPNGSLGGVTAGSNIVVSTPNPNSPTVAVTNAPTFSGAVTANSFILTNGLTGCLYPSSSTGALFSISSSCGSVTQGTFVIPAVGASVSVPLSAGQAIYMANTPLTINDGTNSISGNTTSTTIGSSTSITFLVERINAGASGNTMANSAFVITGGYDAGASNTLTAGANIQPITGPTPSVATTMAPTFTGLVTAADVLVNGSPAPSNLAVVGGTSLGTAGSYAAPGSGAGVLYEGNAAGVGGQQSMMFPTNNGSYLVDGLSGTLFTFYNSGAGAAADVMDASGNFAAAGSLLSGTLVSGRCLQAGTNGIIGNAAGACGSGSGTVTSVTGTANQISVATGTTTPVISIPSSPTLPGTTTVGSLVDTFIAGSNGCVTSSTGAILSRNFPCAAVVLNSFVIPAIGSAVSVTLNTGDNVSLQPGMPLTITDGSSHSISGFVTSSVTNVTTFSFTNTFVNTGAVGNTMAAGAFVTTGSQNPVTSTAPTLQKFTSGSGTYTTPAGVKWIKVRVVGAGGGGGGTNTGGTGGTGGSSTFGTSLISAVGGTGGANLTGFGGVGGTATLGSGPLGYAVSGGQGSVAMGGSGGLGGSSCLGGAGGQAGNGIAGTGLAGATNTGGGGGGGAGTINSASGGGSGGCVEAIINAPLSTYSYAVGAAGTAGTAGSAGTLGGAGGSGYVQVEEHYNF